jgi:hypothetical protein
MQTFIHDSTGRIIQGMSGGLTPAELAGFQARGILVVTAPSDASYEADYVVDGQLVPRPVADIQIDRTEILADDKDMAIVTGLPVPCVVLVDGEPVTVEDGRLEMTSDMPATYSIVFDQFPVMPWSAEVIAVEPLRQSGDATPD